MSYLLFIGFIVWSVLATILWMVGSTIKSLNESIESLKELRESSNK